MHHYPHHIGDFNNATRHLSRIERSIYRDLIELYYETESCLTNDIGKLARRILATSEIELESLKYVLNEYFQDTENGWFHSRCEEELAKYHDKANRAVRANKSRWRSDHDLKSDTKSDSISDVKLEEDQKRFRSQPTTNNHKPITKNQEPRTTHTESEEVQPAKPSLAAAVCVLLKSEGIGSVNPQNPTLVNLIQDGADIGMFAEAARISKSKGKGFAYVLGVVKSQLSDAAHVAAQARDSPSKPNETAYQRSVRERVEEATGRRTPDDRTVIDITPGQTQTARLA